MILGRMLFNKKVSQIFFLLIFCASAYSQQVGINILYPDSSAMLQVEANDKGFLPPRLTTVQRDLIPNPAQGLIIYNTNDSTIQYFNGICWINTYQVNCDDCFFTMTGNIIADTIDRVVTDSTQFQLTIDQNAGTPQFIALASIGANPPGMTVSINPNPQFSSGIVNVTVHVTPFTPAGTYPIIIQALCGSYMQNFIFSLTLTPCYLLNVNNTITNYSTSVDLYNTFPSAPTASPVCVVVTVNPGVDVTSPTTAQPAFTTGSLPSGSVVALVNGGNIIGKGGDGGIAYDPVNGWTGAGFNGGDAVNLTANTTVQNNFNIYGGGGGGGSAAFGLSYSLPLGLPTLTLLIGAGGGGGAGGGLGGNIPGGLGLVFYAAGTDATVGQLGVPGNGGLLQFPINFSAGPATISINPNAYGGNGGDYGAPGTQGRFQVTLTITVTVTIIVPITITVLNNYAIPLPVPIPPAGNAGYAIKRNGNITNVPDNNYNTSFLKGRVGN